ncbi:glycerate kinase, partial [Salmonella enterica subsp. enterica serovar Kentucky]|nr:glycerate kinase [Salmonella enterica subsp. enterica serovar Kentucky]
YQNDRLSYNKTLGCILGFAGVMVVNVSNGLDFSFNLPGEGSVNLAHYADIIKKSLDVDVKAAPGAGAAGGMGAALMAFLGAELRSGI